MEYPRLCLARFPNTVVMQIRTVFVFPDASEFRYLVTPSWQREYRHCVRHYSTMTNWSALAKGATARNVGLIRFGSQGRWAVVGLFLMDTP